MKRILIAVLSCLATVAIAETDYIAMPRIDAILDGQESFTKVSAADVRTATITTTGAATLDSARVTGTLQADAMFTVYTGVGSTNVQLSAVTPSAKGQFAYAAANLLSAVSGAGTTGTLAVAKGVTTNDWVIVK